MVKVLDRQSGRFLKFPDDCRFRVVERSSGRLDVLVTGSVERHIGYFDVSSLPSLRFEHVEKAFSRLNEEVSSWLSFGGNAFCIFPSDVVRSVDWSSVISGSLSRPLGQEVFAGRDIDI